jgi:hypothetical protein
MAKDVNRVSWSMGAQEIINQMLKTNHVLKIGQPQHGRTNPDRGREDRSLPNLAAELKPVTVAWITYQANRDRNAVYGYLEAVFAVVAKWTRLGCTESRTVQALRSLGLKCSKNVEPFAAVIACTANVDRKTKSKWSRALRQAARLKDKGESLSAFIKRHGGINGCASGVPNEQRGRKVSRATRDWARRHGW